VTRAVPPQEETQPPRLPYHTHRSSLHITPRVKHPVTCHTSHLARHTHLHGVPARLVAQVLRAVVQADLRAAGRDMPSATLCMG
jgi:hypothetical protein